MPDEKEIRWLGSAFDDLLAFPAEVRRHAGFQLRKVQAGLNPDNWKPQALASGRFVSGKPAVSTG
jgi:phage-related protein